MKPQAKRWFDEQNRIEAVRLDEKANIFKVRYLYGKLGCRCGGHKHEGESALPGGLHFATSYHRRERAG